MLDEYLTCCCLSFWSLLRRKRSFELNEWGIYVCSYCAKGISHRFEDWEQALWPELYKWDDRRQAGIVLTLPVLPLGRNLRTGAGNTEISVHILARAPPVGAAPRRRKPCLRNSVIYTHQQRRASNLLFHESLSLKVLVYAPRMPFIPALQQSGSGRRDRSLERNVKKFYL